MEIKNKQLARLMAEDGDTDEQGEPMPITAEDLDNSQYNPANDAYLAQTKHLQNRMISTTRTMRASHITVAKLLDSGMKNKDIALRVRLTAVTVGNISRREDVRRLRDLMMKYSALLAGATQAMRDAMLYRIAVRNEISDPKVSISAIAEANKLVHNDRVHALNKKTGGNNTQTVVVQLSDARLRPSQLDELPSPHTIKEINPR